VSDPAPEPTPGTPVVEFWFDPVCPFTWRTSRWLVDIAARGSLAVSWNVMSLAILKDGGLEADADGEGAESVAALRALVAAEDAGGQEALAKLYTLLGSRKHDGGQSMTPDGVRRAVSDAGLPGTVGDAVDDRSYDSRISASHEQSQARGGMRMGSPVLALDGGRGYFGPVLAAVPEGDAALRLFEAVRLLASVPAFSEIKTSRS
jgi:2-hydroxychromene-2-carboxylate isomerase